MARSRVFDFLSHRLPPVFLFFSLQFPKGLFSATSPTQIPGSFSSVGELRSKLKASFLLAAVRAAPRAARTCVVDDKPGVADGCVASESKEEAVTAALYPLGQLRAVEASDQGAE